MLQGEIDGYQSLHSLIINSLVFRRILSLHHSQAGGVREMLGGGGSRSVFLEGISWSQLSFPVLAFTAYSFTHLVFRKWLCVY